MGIDYYEILDVKMSKNERLYLEAFHIRSQNHSLNRDSICLDPMYDVQIDKEKQ